MTDSPAEPYRLGLDLGTNSIGWAAIRLDGRGEPTGVLDMGVRIFPDGREPGKRSKPSRSVARREALSQRRRRDRYLRRQRKFMKLLIRYGLMPCDDAERKALAGEDPYELRMNAVKPSVKLPVHHVGRALFHLNQRRGFKSNRKAEKRDNDTGPAKDAAKRLGEALQGRTLGSFLYEWSKGDQKDEVKAHLRRPIRFRNLGTAYKAKYEFYPTRQMILDEFDKIWETQAEHHKKVMTKEAKKDIRDTLEQQMPLPPSPVGKCTLDPAKDPEDAEGFHCPQAHPLAQRFRIWQEVRNLEAQEVGQPSCPLSKEQGDTVAQALLRQNKVSFDKIRTLLNLPSEVYFNLESQKRKHLLGDETAAKLAHKDLFGKTWRRKPLDEQIEIVERLLDEEDEDSTISWLTGNAGVDREAAERVASARLPDRHRRLGLRAIRSILPHMESGMNYPEAARAAGYDHAQAPTGELSPTGRLPYYGEWLREHLNGTGHSADPKEKRWGRYPNPTVHVGLTQLRRVVNALIKEYGPPHQIVVEMTRQFPLSGKKRLDLENEQTENQEKNRQLDARIEEVVGEQPTPEKRKNREKMRLWEELNPKNCLDRRCPFTGEPISLTQLFSAEVEVEHLIPRADSFDNSLSNKVVCFRTANRHKGDRTPYEAFGASPEWESILQRAAKLPKNKRWRFSPDARRQFEKQGGFLARQLNETGWLARLVKQYLTAVVHPNHIWVSPGRLTAMIRAKWGLNDLLPNHNAGNVKDRTDHRHHAIDALVVALTDRSLLQRVSSAYDETRSKIKVPLPWTDFQNTVKRKLDKVVVSHRPDHGTTGAKGKNDNKTSGQLHNKTAYGLINFVEDGVSTVVHRKALSDFKTRADLKSAARDSGMRKALLKLWDKVEAEVVASDGKSGAIAAEVARRASEGVLINGRRQPVRGLRVIEHLHVMPVKDSEGDRYKGYAFDSNAFADVWRMSNKSWKVVVVSAFDANQPDFNVERFRPMYRGRRDLTAERIMRLYKNDMGALGEGANLHIVTVRKFSQGTVVLDDHNEADVDARERDGRMDRKGSIYSASKLRKEGFRKVRVDEIGRVWDTGPPA